MLLSPAWYRALTLAERSRTLSEDIVSLPRYEKQEHLGKRRLLRWQSQPQFSQKSVLEQRLASLGIDRDGLTYLLAEQWTHCASVRLTGLRGWPI